MEITLRLEDDEVERLLNSLELVEDASEVSGRDDDGHPWTESELREFLEDTKRKTYREAHAILLRTVAEEGPVSKEELRSRTGGDPSVLLSHLNRRMPEGKEKLVDSTSTPSGRDYFITDEKYAEAIKENL